MEDVHEPSPQEFEPTSVKIKMYPFISEQQNSVDFNFTQYCEVVPETNLRRKKNTGIFSIQWLIRLPV